MNVGCLLAPAAQSLQGELVQMQLWVKEAKAKIAVLFELPRRGVSSAP